MQLNHIQVQWYLFESDGVIPNNPRCPAALYPGVLDLSGPDPAAGFEQLFQRNQWGNSWRNGVFPFHHYHSTAHEVLGVFSGWAEVQLGGEQGKPLRIEAGDAVVVPAGVAHKKLRSGKGFACVGAYPRGQDPDLCRQGTSHDRNAATVSSVDLPLCDPLYGRDGPLVHRWTELAAAGD